MLWKNEFETMTEATVNTRNLARFGDGELRLAIGGKAISQKADPALAAELRQILAGETKALPCVPPFVWEDINRSPKRNLWFKYADPRYREMYKADEYGSSLVTRPDSAPWIDDDRYWWLVSNLWRGMNVVYVTGGDSHLIPIMKDEAESFQLIVCDKTDAYGSIGKIESEIIASARGQIDFTVLLACGATGTVLAHRLANHDIHAVDIGHMGMFFSVQGAYRMKPQDLATDYYRQQLKMAHQVKKWGGGGGSHATNALLFAKSIGAKSMTDYGCGRGTFKVKMKEISPKTPVNEYDPGIPGKEGPPKPADLIVCTDVMEHIEPELVDNVLKHIFTLGRKGAFFVIAKGPANKMLPDGRNAHLVQEGLEFWKKKIEALGYSETFIDENRKHVIAHCTK